MAIQGFTMNLVSIHVLAGLSMYKHQWSQTITAFATKAYELATKSHMLNFCEGLRGLCRDMLLLWSIETNNPRNKTDFLSSEKKSEAKNKKYNDDFRKVVTSD